MNLLKDLIKFLDDLTFIKHRKGHNWKNVADSIGIKRQHLTNALTAIRVVIPKLKKQYLDKNKHLLK